MLRAPRILPALLLSTSFALSACGGGGKPKPDPAAKAAADAKAKEEKEREERLAKRKAEREAKEAAEAKAAEELKAKVDAVCVLPEKMPKNLKAACEAVVQANDAFMKKQYADKPDVLAKWNEAKGTQLGMTRQQCIKEGSLEVAACQANALNSAGPELKKELATLLRTCKEKFASGPKGEAKAG